MENIDNQTMQERLYNILKMNIKLTKKNKLKIDQDTLDNFREVAKKIDEFKQKKYEESIEVLLKPETTIEGEQERLKQLTTIIKDRLDSRNSLVSEYRELTETALTDLPIIEEENDYEELKKRLEDITEYLYNKNKIEEISSKLENLRQQLYSSETKKQEDENNNKELEEKLFKEFTNLLSQSGIYSEIISVENIDLEITNLQPDLEESKKTLNTFEKALDNLLEAGISGGEENDYKMYVADARNAYYQIKEKEYLLRILKILSNIQTTFEDLMLKRENLDKLLSERDKMRLNLSITSNDLLKKLYNFIEIQKSSIILEGININTIEELYKQIENSEKSLEEYEEKNKRGDILTILEEYGLVETYKEEEIVGDSVSEPMNHEELVANPLETQETEEKKVFSDFDLEEEKENDVILKDPYTIIKVTALPDKNSLSFAFKKAYSVMRRVGKSLGIFEKKILEPKISVEPKALEETAIMAPIVDPNALQVNDDTEVFDSSVSLTSETEPFIPVLEELREKETNPKSKVIDTPTVPYTEPKDKSIDDKTISMDKAILPSSIIDPTPKMEPAKPQTVSQDKPTITNNTGFFWPEVESTSSSKTSQEFFPNHSTLDLPPIPNASISLNSQPGKVKN